MKAMRHVIATSGKLGFNAKFLVEMGEEVNSPGLRELCAEHRESMKADVMIASDGPRLSAARPTIFLGTRGCMTIDLSIEARDKAYHSGNWVGLISDPGIVLAHALAAIVSPTGQIRIPEWVPPDFPDSVRRALSDCEMDGGTEGACIEEWWGEPGLTPVERMFGWSNFTVLAFKSGNPQMPVNAIPSRAWARCDLRTVVGVDPAGVLPALRRHLDRHGFGLVKVALVEDTLVPTRIDPDDEWVQWTAASMARATGKKPAILPNLGGSLPNDIFTDVLGLRTIWIPHSYSGCSQHAPNEHLPTGLLCESLEMMTSVYWDLGSGDTPAARA